MYIIIEYKSGKRRRLLPNLFEFMITVDNIQITNLSTYEIEEVSWEDVRCIHA